MSSPSLDEALYIDKKKTSFLRIVNCNYISMLLAIAEAQVRHRYEM